MNVFPCTASGELDPDVVHVSGDVVGEHACPTCAGPVVDIYRPGRGRIYCSNACRQRAYRWRRSRGVRWFVARDGAAERLLNDRRHALRNPDDPVSRLQDGRRRDVTVCGTFGRPVRDMRVTHDRFVPEHPWSCRSCASLIAAGPPGTGIPEVVRRFAAGLDDWTSSSRPSPGRRADLGTDLGIDVGTDLGTDLGTDVGIDVRRSAGTSSRTPP